MKRVYVDTETTGLRPGQIAQLSMIIEDENSVVGVNEYFSVDTMEEGAYNVHGLSKEFLECNPKFKDRALDIYNTIKESALIAHNIDFDERFISTEMLRAGISFIPEVRMCTMHAFRDIMKIPSKNIRYGEYKNPKLEEVISYLNIHKEKVNEFANQVFETKERIGYHDSRFDVTAMYIAVKVFSEKLNRAEGQWHKFCN